MEQKQNYFKIPFLNLKNKDSKLHIIGIIDASGSMSSWWKWIAEFWNSDLIPKESVYTITFDHIPRVQQNNVLSKRIFDHGGGRTAIPDAFQVYENHLNTLPADLSITTIFISDGQDNNLETLEARIQALKGNQKHKINFICLGIQKDFPTFLSMRLRSLYHKGDENIPVLYLIEYVSEKAFFNKFEGMKNYFYSSGLVKVDPPVNLYPWDETVVGSAYEGSWVILKNDEIQLNDQGQFKANQYLNIEDLVELFRGWVQSLQILALQDVKEAQKCAQITLKEMNSMIETINQKMKLNVRKISSQMSEQLLQRYEKEQLQAIKQQQQPLKQNQNDQQQQKKQAELEQQQVQLELENKKESNGNQDFDINESFYDKAKRNYIFRYGSKINWFFDEVEKIAQGKSVKQENEFELAKRMNIGTITGKYHQKALALKSLTVGEFQILIKEFVDVFKKTKIKNDTSCPLKQIFKQPSFLEGFEYIKTQFDLVETFPLYSQGLKIKRSEGFEVNPWLIEFKYLVNKQIDLVSLTIKQFKIDILKPEFIFSEKQINDNSADVNCVFPLFQAEDSDIQDILNTRLIKFLISFNLTQNFDQIFEDSYLSLIGSCVIFIYQNQQNNQNKAVCQQYLKQCAESLHVFYSNNQNFKQFADQLINNHKQMLTQNMAINDFPLEKYFVTLFYLLHFQQISVKQAEQVIEGIRMISLRKIVNKHNIQTLLKPDLKIEEKEELTQYFNKEIDSYFTISDFRKNFSSKYESFIKQQDRSCLISRRYVAEQPILTAFEVLQSDLMQQQFDMMEYTYLAWHVSLFEFDFLEKQIERNKDLMNQQVMSKIDEQSIKFFPGYTDIYKQMDDLFATRFAERHWETVAMTEQQLEIAAKIYQVDVGILKYNKETGLCANACMSPKCPFFMKPQKELFFKHMGGWKGRLPIAFHKIVKRKPQSSLDDIIKEGQKKWGKDFPNNYGVDKQFVANYVTQIQKQYADLQNGQQNLQEWEQFLLKNQQQLKQQQQQLMQMQQQQFLDDQQQQQLQQQQQQQQQQQNQQNDEEQKN